MTFDRLTICTLVALAATALSVPALAGDSELTPAPAADEVVIEPDWEAIAHLLDEERASRVQDLLDELDFVASKLRDGTTPLAADLSAKVADARAKVAGLWEVIGNPYENAGEADTIFGEMAPVVAFVDEFVALTGVEDSDSVEREWKYARRDFDDLRTRFEDS